MVSKPWQNYFDDVQQPKAPIDVLENNPHQISVSLFFNQNELGAAVGRKTVILV